MKTVKKIAIILSFLLALLFFAAFLVPALFKGPLVRLAQQKINENVNATVEFEDVSLSLLRNFPDITLCVENFKVTGIDQFAGVPLAVGKRLDLTLQFWSVMNQSTPIQLKSVSLESPTLNILVLKDGKANYDIAKAAEDTAEPEEPGDELKFSLKRYRISDGQFIYDDRSLDTYIKASHLNHVGSGNFTLTVFDLDTESTIDSLTIRQGGLTYLNDTRILLDAVFNIDQSASKYTLKDNQLTVNDFQLEGDGFFQLIDDDIAMDLSLKAPTNNFKDLWSLIPNAYVQGYENVQAEGQFQFDGVVRGTYNGDREQYPSFNFNLGVQNGKVKYPDLPLAISDINTRANINSPSSNFDEVVIDVPEFRVRIGDSPFQARFHLTTPISDPDLDAAVKGVIDLKALSQSYPMEGMESLTGIIRADVEAQTRLSYVENKDYERVKMQGDLGIEKMNYQYGDYPPIVINEAKMTFNPASVDLQQFDARFGKSDLRGGGKINNLLAYFSPEKTMTGSLTLQSDFFDVNEWYSEGADESEAAVPQTAPPATDEEIFNRFDFYVDARAGEIVYDSYRLLNTSARGQVAPNRIELREGFTRIGDSDFALSGIITNGFDYVYEDGILGGKLKLDSKFLDLNQFMEPNGASTAASSGSDGESLEPILVPGNMAMTIDANIDRLQYTNLELRNLKGELVVEDRTLVLNDVQTSALGGTINFSGGYDTKDAQNPAFNFKYDLTSMDFQKSFNTFNTFQAMAPIAKFITGTFNTSLIMSGVLGANMMPRLSSLNAQGFLETLNGVIQNFKPLQAVGQQLNVQYLKEDWQIVNTKNWFEVKDGFVEVKDFDTKIKDIPMIIGGRHGLNQEMDYKIRASIPRKLLDKSSIGQAANTGLNLLADQASKLGINIQQGENINIQINLTGTITQPKVGFKLLGVGGESSLADAAKAELEAEAQKQIDQGKAIVEETANKAVDSAKTILDQQAQRAQEEAKRQADSLLKKAGEEAGQQLGDEAKKALDQVLDSTSTKGVDEIKKELDKWNPFKKKTAPKDTTKTKNND